MARNILLILGSGLGSNLGPNFNLTANVGSVTPSTATKTELLGGKNVSVDDAATQVTVTSIGVCANSITQTIPCSPPTSILISPSSYTGTISSCAATESLQVYYAGTIGDGNTLYTDSGLTTFFDGDGDFYKIGSNHVGRINGIGVIYNYTPCSTTTTTTTAAPTTTTTSTTTTAAPTTTTTSTTTAAPTTTTTTTTAAPIGCGAGSSYSGGEAYPTEQSVILGSDIGTVILDYNAFDIPDRFIVEWNNNIVIDTGYRGGSSYDFGGASRSSFNSTLTGRIDPITLNAYPDLTTYPDDGYPRILGLGLGTTSFVKNLASPTTVTIKIYGPMPSTGWSYTLNCPVATTTTTTAAPTTTTTSTTTAAPTTTTTTTSTTSTTTAAPTTTSTTSTTTTAPTTTSTTSTTTTTTAAPVGRSWSTSTALITPRYWLAGAGTQNAGLAFGGDSGVFPFVLGCTEIYDGSAWSAGSALSLSRRDFSGAGIQTAALAFGGVQSGNSLTPCTEAYNGSAWSTGGALITARTSFAGAGTQNAGLAFGGGTPLVSCTEEYNGSSWSSGGALINARFELAGAGTQTAGLAFGGYAPSGLSCTEEYNGSTNIWSAGGALITGRQNLAGDGTQNAGLAFGGNTPSSRVSCTEEYNGTLWSTGGALITARIRLAGAGTQTAGLAFGGNIGGFSAVSCTEEYT